MQGTTILFQKSLRCVGWEGQKGSQAVFKPPPQVQKPSAGPHAHHASYLGPGPYLRLDSVQTSKPQDLATSQLPLSMVNLFHVLCELLLRDLFLLCPMTSFFEEL